MKDTVRTTTKLMLPVVKREDRVKITVSLPADLNADLTAYQRAYQDMNGAEISVDLILEHVLRQHLKRDKAFQTWISTNGKGAAE
jgi:hypothetical protein